ncbi:TraB/GumN family protein [Tsuneonella sp. HG222]
MFRKLFATLLAFALPGCATAGNLYAPDPRFVAPAMWEVSDGDTKIYLFGTVHALTENAGWFAGPIADAYNASDELVTEIPLGQGEADSRAIIARAALPAGQNLRNMMTPDNRVQYEEAMVSLGLPVEALDRYEPWYASMTLALLPVMKQGFNPQTGAENALAARSGSKNQLALETLDQQIDIFDGLPMDAQLTFLDETVEGIGTAGQTLQAMVDKWLAGDAQSLAVLMNDELEDPVLYRRLMTDRNRNWADWIGQRLGTPGTSFVAVGAGHLAGKGSVQDLLQRRGIKVRRVMR